MSTDRLLNAGSGNREVRCFFSGTDAHPIYVDRFAARQAGTLGHPRSFDPATADHLGADFHADDRG